MISSRKLINADLLTSNITSVIWLISNKLESSFKPSHNKSMKNKVTATGSEYQSTIEEIFKSLHKLKAIMNRPEFEKYASSEEAEEEGNVYGCLEAFISDTAYLYTRE